MTALLLRVLILLLVTALGVGAVWSGRLVIGQRRHRALAAPAFTATRSDAAVSILAFHTEDCRQCFTMQAPALERVRAARGTQVGVIDIDAIAHPDLAEQYHVLTVPTTVILDPQGKAYAVNYGFTPTQRLLKQVDALLAQALVAEAS